MSCCREFTQRNAFTLVIIFGLFTILPGILLAIYFPTIFDGIFFKQLALKPGSKSYEYWSEPPQPLYLDIYLFNWTNPQDFTNKSIKPIFEEIGPFRYQEFPEKTNVKFHENNSTVSYRKLSRYFFIPDDSKGQMDDVITSVNLISLSAATRAKEWGYFASKTISFGFTVYSNKVYVTKTAREWLFEGFEDPMINIAKSNPLLSDIPSMFDRFGWFYKKNNTDFMLGDFNVNTGVDDIMKIGKIRKWNHEATTDFFPEECATLSGSSGDFFPPHITKDQTLQLFSPEMCRSIPMDFEDEVEIHGIKTYKFSGGDRAVDNGTIYPENECFCGGECVPAGLFNVSSCRYGSPVFMSFPHFYHADPYYLEQIDGMSPDKEKHQFFMSFEPKTAIPLEVAARFQINLLIEPISTIAMYRDVPKKFIPILWFEQHVKMSSNIADEIKIVLSLPVLGQKMGIAIAVISFAIFTAIILKLLFSKFRWNQRRRKIRDYDLNGNKVNQKKIDDNGPEVKMLILKEALYGISVK